MSNSTNKVAIGAFVLGAASLAVAGVLVFGGKSFFESTEEVVMYFDASTKGLNVGAPVALKGVKIGSVSSIDLQMDIETLEYRTEVVASFSGSSTTPIGSPEDVAALQDGTEAERKEATNSFLRQLVENGLRAKLEQQSFVTGMLMIEVDIHEEVEPADLKRDPEGRWVIPTIPSDMARLARTLESLPFEDILNDLSLAAHGIQTFVNSNEINEILDNTRAISAHVREFTSGVGGRVDHLQSGATKIIEDLEKVAAALGPLTEELEGTLAETRELVSGVGDRVGPIADGVDAAILDARTLLSTANTDLSSTSEEARETLSSATGVLELLSGPVSPEAEVLYRLTVALEQLAAASDRMGALATYLELHPEALLKGKDD